MKTTLSRLLPVLLALASSAHGAYPPPLQANLDSAMVGVVPFAGAGARTEYVDFDARRVQHVRLRIPNACALQVQRVVFRGPQGRAAGQLVTTFNDGAYSHFVYGLGHRGADLSEVELSLNSPFYYPTHQRCGVRVYVSGQSRRGGIDSGLGTR